jgi:hypothetical protein
MALCLKPFSHGMNGSLYGNKRIIIKLFAGARAIAKVLSRRNKATRSARDKWRLARATLILSRIGPQLLNGLGVLAHPLRRKREAGPPSGSLSDFPDIAFPSPGPVIPGLSSEPLGTSLSHIGTSPVCSESEVVYLRRTMSNQLRCKKCGGTLRVETATDLHSGLIIRQYVCFNCGRRWHSEKEPRPLTAA